MEFLEAFTKWAKKQSLEFGYYNDCKKCKLFSVDGEPDFGIYRGGYCDTCAYEEGCLEFRGTCSSGKSHYYQVRYINFGQMIRELTDLK